MRPPGYSSMRRPVCWSRQCEFAGWQLVADPVGGGGTQRGHRLWPAGDRRQFHQRPDYPVRAAYTGGTRLRWVLFRGRVTKIRIRATTIRDFDRRELLVPNKEFITQQLLNWSLSDQVTRWVVEVGVAYGTDLDKGHG